VKTNSGIATEAPDLQMHFVHYLFPDPVYADPVPNPPMGFTFWPTLVRPQSRGTIRLRSADPADPARIRARYLECESEVQVLVEGFRISRELVQMKQFDPFRGQEVAPGPGVKSEAEIKSYIRLAAGTIFHPVGTCKMGHDEMAVVDDRLQVRGVEGLRVVDASVMPLVTSGNTNAATIMIAEKASDMIKRAWA
jgi:choline dehydrogenase